MKELLLHQSLENYKISNITIYHLDKNYKLKEKIFSKEAEIRSNNWILEDVTIYYDNNGIFENNKKNSHQIKSNYNYEKINSLFKNFDSISFIQLILKYENLLDNGYNERYLNQNLQTMLTLPFFLCLMTAIASILTMGALKRADNFKIHFRWIDYYSNYLLF